MPTSASLAAETLTGAIRLAPLAAVSAAGALPLWKK
jgi:hypothetical protein